MEITNQYARAMSCTIGGALEHQKVKNQRNWSAPKIALRPIIRRGIIDLVYLAAGIFTENVNKTGKMAKNRFLADFVDFIVQPC